MAISKIENASLASGVPSRSQLPAGTVLQVVNTTYAVETANSSSTFADTGLTATITPTSSTSKILVLVNQAGCAKADSNTMLQLKLLRGSTVILKIEDLAAYDIGTSTNVIGACSATYLDTPTTTSAVTYKTQFASRQNTAVVRVQSYGSVTDGTTSTITLMEIAA